MSPEVTKDNPEPSPQLACWRLPWERWRSAQLAIGVLAIGRLAVGRLVIKKARFNELEVGDLTVHRLRVVEHKGPGS